MEEDPPRFLFHLHEDDLLWTFQLVGRWKVYGQVINYIKDSDGIPVTVSVHEIENDTKVEIPWSIIQTITYEGKRNG